MMEVIKLLLIALFCTYVLGVITLGLGNWIMEFQSNTREAFTWPAVKHSILMGLLWPYYAYILLGRE